MLRSRASEYVVESWLNHPRQPPPECSPPRARSLRQHNPAPRTLSKAAVSRPTNAVANALAGLARAFPFRHGYLPLILTASAPTASTIASRTSSGR
jgi:hypothetical protein